MNPLLARRPRLLVAGVAALWFLALGSAAAAIYLKHRSREVFVELERANAHRDNLEIEWGQLQLEQSAWSTHALVERIAGKKLHMAMPPPQGIRIVAQPVALAPAPTASPPAAGAHGPGGRAP